MKDIVVSVVCFNNEAEIINFADQLSKQLLKERICLIITCNACSNPTELREKISKYPIESIIYEPCDNLGYLHGCLAGLKVYLNDKDLCWALICNTDITFEKNDFFKSHIDRITDMEIWCVGPKIIQSDTGRNQNPFLEFRPSKQKMRILKMAFSSIITFNLYFWLACMKSKLLRQNAVPSKNRFVYAVHGSCFLISNDLLQLLLEDENKIFMYGEELLIAEIVQQNSKMIFYDDEITIRHHENQVTGKISIKKRQQWMKASLLYLYDRFFAN
jgi:GT2 family glycosyltransferase